MTSLVVNTISKFLVTTLAGVDFVVGEIASQRDFEVYLESGIDRGDKRGGRVFGGGGGKGGARGRVEEMMEQRNARLDDLCKANRDPELIGADDYIVGKHVQMGQVAKRANAV
jgi:hypothetical protein